MAVRALSAGQTDERLFGALFREGLRVMLERLPLYFGLAAVCAASGILQPGNPFNLASYPAFRVTVGLALVAIFFILPSALRRLRPSFRMTWWRATLAVLLIVSISLVTELGFMAAVIPGIVAGVLLSQALLVALLRSSERPAGRALASSAWRAVSESFALTKLHFGTTLAVVTLSVLILGVPLFVVMLAMVIGYNLDARSLLLTAPLLYLTFIYFECVRYTLVVRWFRHLEQEAEQGWPLATGS